MSFNDYWSNPDQVRHDSKLSTKIGKDLKHGSQFMVNSIKHLGANIPFDVLRMSGVPIKETLLSPTGLNTSANKSYTEFLMKDIPEAANSYMLGELIGGGMSRIGQMKNVVGEVVNVPTRAYDIYYHGSPWKWKKFNPTSLGKGEGASKRGIGLNLFPENMYYVAPKFANIRSADAPIHLGKSRPLSSIEKLFIRPTIYEFKVPKDFNLKNMNPIDFKNYNQLNIIKQGYKGVKTSNQVTIFPEFTNDVIMSKRMSINKFVSSKPNTEWVPWSIKQNTYINSEGISVFNPDRVFKAGKNLIKPEVGKSETSLIKKGYKEIKVPQKQFKSEIDWGKWNKEIPNNKALMEEYAAIEKMLNETKSFGINPATNKPYNVDINLPKEINIVLRSENFKKAFPDFNFDTDAIYRGERYVRKGYINKERPTDVIFGTSDFEGAAHYVNHQNTKDIIHPHKIDEIFKKYNIKEDGFIYNDGSVGGINVLAIPNKSKTLRVNAKNNKFTMLPNHLKLNQEYVRNNTQNIKYYIKKYGKDKMKIPKDYNDSKLYASTDNYASALNDGLKDYNRVLVENVYDGINKPIKVSIINPRNTPIKSIFYNNGMFDMTNPNIYKGLIPPAIGIGTAIQSQTKNKTQTLPVMNNYAEGGSLLPGWDKVKATLNPKNWGVPDYTDKGSRGAAYSAAKRAGEKEFMWNGNRFHTKYAGTVQEEVKSYFPEYNVITGVEPGNYVTTALHVINKSKSTKWPHVFTGDLNKKTAIDYPDGYSYSELGVSAYDDTKYYASKINTDSIYDEISKRTENYNAGEYDVINNNCAGTVCAGLDLPYGKLPLPSTVPMKLKLKYPTIELTSNVTDSKELSNLYNRSYNDGKDSLLNTNINTLEKHSSDKYLIKLLQDTLFKKGYKLPKSTKQDGSFDGIWGDETKKALLDYQTKNKTNEKN